VLRRPAGGGSGERAKCVVSMESKSGAGVLASVQSQGEKNRHISDSELSSHIQLCALVLLARHSATGIGFSAAHAWKQLEAS
jgi:hypothetical protein